MDSNQYHYQAFNKMLELLEALVDSKLWVKVVVAMILGIGAGVLLSPSFGLVAESISKPLGNWLALPGKLFLKLVQMIMIPLILASIITGLINTGSDQLKKLGAGVTIYFLASTAISVTIAVVLTNLINPGSYLNSANQKDLELSYGTVPKGGSAFSDIPGAITSILPDNPLASMVSGEMLPIVIFGIIIGIAVMQLNDSSKAPLVKILEAVQEICMVVIKWATLLVPFAVFGLLAQLISSIGLSSLKGIGLYAATVLLGLLIILVLYLFVVAVLGRQNPFKFLKEIKEVQLLAFSTTSSAAVIPLSIKTAQEKLGVSTGISNFLVPLGATVNMDGTALYQCISTLFIAQVYGVDMGLQSTLLIVFTIVAASVGTPSIPGGGVVVLASVLQSAGIPTEGVVIIIGVERVLGMFRTAINVTGDLTACVVFQRLTEPDSSA